MVWARINIRCLKVLQSTIQKNKKWEKHIQSIVTKACKRLYIFWLLCWGCVPPVDLTNISFTLIRFILEYFREVWTNGIPLYLSDERKSAKGCHAHSFPGHSYNEGEIKFSRRLYRILWMMVPSLNPWYNLALVLNNILLGS